MPLIRGHHHFDDHFTQIPNQWLRDARLSFKARGILALLMSHTQGWQLSIASLAEQNREGKDAIRSAIQELEELGYLTRSQVNEGGKFGESTWTTNDPADLPLSGFPPSDNPTPKKNIIKEEQFKNTKEEGDFETFWSQYPRSESKAQARRAYQKALRKISHEKLMEALARYKAHNSKNQIIFAYAATWLNGERYLDEYETPGSPYAEKSKIERERSQEFLAEQEALARQAAPVPKCEHGESIVRCRKCLRG